MIIKVRSGWRLVGNAILSHPVSNNAAQKSSFSENEKFSSSITKKIHKGGCQSNHVVFK